MRPAAARTVRPVRIRRAPGAWTGRTGPPWLYKDPPPLGAWLVFCMMFPWDPLPGEAGGWMVVAVERKAVLSCGAAAGRRKKYGPTHSSHSVTASASTSELFRELLRGKSTPTTVEAHGRPPPHSRRCVGVSGVKKVA